jgi:hypothetical protein
VPGVSSHQNVVRLGAAEIEDAQFRLGPPDAVGTFGVADHFVILGMLHLAGLERRGLHIGGIIDTPVIHADLGAIAKDGDVGADVAFPGLVEGDCLSGGDRLVEGEPCLFQGVDQIVINEQLQVASEPEGRLLRRQTHGEYQKKG